MVSAQKAGALTRSTVVTSDPMPDTIRAFVAFELPRRVMSCIEEIQSRLKKSDVNLRWVRPESIHLTLKFLGNIQAADVEAIGGALEFAAQGVAPLVLEATALGVFPNLRRPRVLWMGIAGQTAGLNRLRENVETALTTLGFPTEARPFTGHLTLGRTKGTLKGRSLLKALETHTDFRSGPFTVDRFFLFKSDLKPTGAEYTKLRAIELFRQTIA